MVAVFKNTLPVIMQLSKVRVTLPEFYYSTETDVIISVPGFPAFVQAMTGKDYSRNTVGTFFVQFRTPKLHQQLRKLKGVPIDKLSTRTE